MKHLFLTLSAASALFIVGCGSSSTSSETVGYFVDAPVQNIDYDCLDDNTTGVTGAGGAFTCQHMNHIRFRIGQLVLGEIDTLPSDGYVFPQDLVGVDREAGITDPEVTAMAQLLQSIDEDQDTATDILIPDAIKTAFDENATFDAEALIDYADEANVTLVNMYTAQNHLRETLQLVQQTLIGYASPTQNIPFDFSTYPLSTLTPELEEALAHMGNEERLAYDVYTNLYNFHLENSGTGIVQLYNVATNSEATHVQTVQALVQRYDLNDTNISVVDPSIVEANTLSSAISFETMPSGVYDIPAIQELYDTLIDKGETSTKDALEVGCMVEVTDVNDLDAYIALAQEANASDIEQAFEYLRSASYNHYWAFDRGLKNLGVTDGCCSLGSEYCRTLDEYPSSHGYGF